MSSYIPVIGLEIHAELLTKSKVFCTCSAEFGGSQNSRCCPVCTGMPGTLPVINQTAVEYAVKAGMALGATSASFLFLTERTTSIRTCRRHIRFPSCIIRFVWKAKLLLTPRTDRSISESTISTWKKMPENWCTMTSTPFLWQTTTVVVSRW